MSELTIAQYNVVVRVCKKLFVDKTADYGPSWLLFRLPSITDQILIKAKRIRQLEQIADAAKIPEGRDAEYRGIINYCVMALIRLWHRDAVPSSDSILNDEHLQLPNDPARLSELYDQVIADTQNLMQRKNHDYGEAWREMRLFAITDQILVKLARLRTIESHQGCLLVSESPDANYADILNWCIFALIKISEEADLARNGTPPTGGCPPSRAM